jgi:hypothetical protein
MTDTEKLDMLKALIDKTSLADSVLLVYLQLAGEKVLRRCYPFAASTQEYNVPERYETIQVELAANEVLKRGAQGQSSFNDNGVSRVYESEDVLLNRIVPYAHVPGVVTDETDRA